MTQSRILELAIKGLESEPGDNSKEMEELLTQIRREEMLGDLMKNRLMELMKEKMNE